jgi:tetratricopeptide (TPR) repeat protein
VGELCGRINAGVAGIYLGNEGATDELSALVEQALPVFEAAGDDLALYMAYSALVEVADARGRMDAGLEAIERAVTHAGRAGHPPSSSLGSRAALRFFGTTPVTELLAWLDDNEPRTGRDHFLRAYRAGSVAMLGRFDEAREILAESRAELAERGGGLLLANITAFESVWVELWAGDAAAAARFGAEGFRLQAELADHGSFAASTAAQAFCALGRFDEAEAWLARAGRGVDDARHEVVVRQVQARVLAHRGEHAQAERLAREAVAMSENTQSLIMQGDANADLAEVLLLSGKRDDAVVALEAAVERYERKGNLVSAQRARARLGELESQAPEQPADP